MLAYLSKTQGIGGAFKESPEDFMVEEITLEGKRLLFGKRATGKGSRGGSYARFVLEKRGWNTVQAIQELASRLRASPKAFGYAGTKDRNAVTTQLCSAWRVKPEELLRTSIRDIKVNGAWESDDAVRLGDLSGNAFRITVRGARPRSSARVKKILGELGGSVPNYFGEQRFGSMRANTHIVGKAILRGDLEGAVKNYLCFSEGETNQESLAARVRLAKENDFADALEYFPRHLKYERAIIRHLAEFKNDFAGALRTLPRGILLMFVHAFQSHIFNECLSARISSGAVTPEKGDHVCPKNRFGFPDTGKAKIAGKGGAKGFLCLQLVGFGSTGLSEFEKSILRREEVSLASFQVKPIPEISSKGGLRPALAPLKSFKYGQMGKTAEFSFSLPPGSYATSALREFMDEKA